MCLILSENNNLLTFVQDLHSGKLHREFHNGPDPTTQPQKVKSHKINVKHFISLLLSFSQLSRLNLAQNIFLKFRTIKITYSKIIEDQLLLNQFLLNWHHRENDIH